MIVLIQCKRDLASTNIASKILENFKPKVYGKFNNENVYLISENVLLVTITKEHIYYNYLDKDISATLKVYPRIMIFLSRHSSKSKMKTLTVHPIGNFSENLYGGLPKTLVWSTPEIMSEALRILYNYSKKLDFKCSYEVTHHGPYVDVPSFFIEIGSDEEAWKNEDAGYAIADTIIELIERLLENKIKETVNFVGLGGGHYAPRFTRYAIDGLNFGHMVPEYNASFDSLKLAIEKTPRAKKIGIHKKKDTKFEEIIEKIKESGIEIIELK